MKMIIIDARYQAVVRDSGRRGMEPPSAAMKAQ